MNYAALTLTLVAGAWVAHVAAQAADGNRIYRCGNEYTNNATDAQARGCRLLEGGNITVVEGTRVANRPAAGATNAPVRVASAPASSGPTRVDGGEQRNRDNEARTIIEGELRKAEARRAELAKEFNNGEPEKLGPEHRNHQKYLDRVAELRASIARLDADIDGLRRELARHGGAAPR